LWKGLHLYNKMLKREFFVGAKIGEGRKNIFKMYKKKYIDGLT